MFFIKIQKKVQIKLCTLIIIQQSFFTYNKKFLKKIIFITFKFWLYFSLNNFKKINGITISNLTNAETFFYNKVNYGVYNYYYNQYIYRFEKKILLTSKNSRIIFFKFFFKLLPLSLNFKIIKNYILYFQNCLFLIKSWRQYKNLPSKGQRTWSNGWTASKAYNIIKELKFKNTTRYFKNIEVAQRSLAFTCEVENLIWLSWSWKWN